MRRLAEGTDACGKQRQRVNNNSREGRIMTPTTLSYTKAGKPVTDKAIVTMSLKKGNTGWQITGWAWADQ
jgi:hypothetical protein